jgi:hypothetical protein
MLITLLEINHRMATGILLSKNQVPFFKASLVAGIMSVILLFMLLRFWDFGIWSLILAGGLAHVVYNNWKWPLEVAKEFKGVTS